MSGRGGNTRVAIPIWLWALLPMLLAAALVVPHLDREVFDVDEAATMLAAGARHLGPYSIFEAVEVSISNWPGQALGHVLAYVIWGRILGWSELAIRALPWFMGILSLAWIYRTGRELFNARVAFIATLLLSTSVVFLVYMHVARSYGPAILFATVALWGYWRVALAPRPVDTGGRLGLLLGATGLLYAHYLCALLLPALGLFHLLFVSRNRRWWQTAILLCLAFLLATPNLTDLLAGINANLALEHLHRAALHAPGVISLIIRYLSSGLLNPRFPVNSLLLVVLVIATALAVWRHRSRRQPPSTTLFLAVTAAFLLLLLMGTNEWIRVLEPRRVRYLSTMWPLVLLLAGAVIQYLPALPWRQLAVIPLVLITVTGAKEFYLDGKLIRESWGGTKSPVSIPLTRVIAEEADDYSLLLVDVDAFRYENRSYEFYTGFMDDRRILLQPDTDFSELAGIALNHDSVLLLYRHSVVDDLRIRELVDHLLEEGWTNRHSWKDRQVSLEYFQSPIRAGQDRGKRLAFDGQTEMTGSRVFLQHDMRLLHQFRID